MRLEGRHLPRLARLQQTGLQVDDIPGYILPLITIFLVDIAYVPTWKLVDDTASEEHDSEPEVLSHDSSPAGSPPRPTTSDFRSASTRSDTTVRLFYRPHIATYRSPCPVTQTRQQLQTMLQSLLSTGMLMNSDDPQTSRTSENRAPAIDRGGIYATQNATTQNATGIVASNLGVHIQPPAPQANPRLPLLKQLNHEDEVGFLHVQHRICLPPIDCSCITTPRRSSKTMLSVYLFPFLSTHSGGLR